MSYELWIVIHGFQWELGALLHSTLLELTGQGRCRLMSVTVLNVNPGLFLVASE